MKKIIGTLAFLTSLLSCQPGNRIYSKNQDLSPQLTWSRKDVKTFVIPVEEIDQEHTLRIAFRYAEGFPYESMLIQVREIAPSGEETVSPYTLTVRNKKGEYIGEPGLDIWDSEHVVDTKKKYTEKGEYTYKIEQAMTLDPVQLVMEIGMILDRNR
jgi:gliding motility-associated lipoprotein GldH